jgi:mannose/cellobiose epimerase-like protein (N-acyl-D-glucosamine 2-epimerase family)
MDAKSDRPCGDERAGARSDGAFGVAIGPAWLAEHAWPLWLEHGIDWKRGAFHEHLDLDGLECRADFRRLRVAARQTYVFSKAAGCGVPRAAAAVALGLEFLRGAARLEDGGYAWRFDLANRPIDTTRDLYDHAFVLLAYAAAADVVGKDELRADALALVDYVSSHFVHPRGGYHESVPPAQPRRQNPHMHLFEALLAASEAFGDDIFFMRARELAEIFLLRFFQAKEGALPEFFNDALIPVREGGRFQVEPGHHYEWIWLLDRYALRASQLGTAESPRLKAASDALLAFADRHALDPQRGLVMNSLWSDGTAADAGFRLWPQTERLKAEARRQKESRASLAASLRALDQHFAQVRPGLWIERIDVSGRPLRDPAPASSLYHLTAALTDDKVISLAVR